MPKSKNRKGGNKNEGTPPQDVKTCTIDGKTDTLDQCPMSVTLGKYAGILVRHPDSKLRNGQESQVKGIVDVHNECPYKDNCPADAKRKANIATLVKYLNGNNKK